MENLSEKHVLPTKLLIKPAQPIEKKTLSGIVIPDVVRSPSCLGTVVLVGKKVEDINIGNSILYSPNAVIKVKVEDEILDLLSYQDTLLFW